MVPVVKRVVVVDACPTLRDIVDQLPLARFRVAHLTWGELEPAVEAIQPNTLFVVQPVATNSALMSFDRIDVVRRLLRMKPRVAVVAVTVHPENHSDLFASLLEEGLTEWVDLAREACVDALARRLHRAGAVFVQRILDRALPPLLPSRTRALLGEAAEVAAAGGNVREFARLLGVSDRTVLRWLDRAELPTSRRLLGWIRLLVAADYLDAGKMTLEGIARATGYSSGPSLKSSIRSMVGATPNQLRASGAFSVVSEAFAEELQTARDERRVVGAPPPRTWLT